MCGRVVSLPVLNSWSVQVLGLEGVLTERPSSVATLVGGQGVGFLHRWWPLSWEARACPSS